MKKIVFFITKLGHGGAERVATNLANEFSRKPENEIYVILTYASEKAYKIEKNINVYELPFSNNKMFRIIKRQLFIHKLLKLIKPDVVISIPEGTAPYIALDTFINKRYQVIFSQRQDPELEYPTRLKKWFSNRVYNAADRVVFQTDEQKLFFEQEVQKKGKVILNPLKEDLPVRASNNVNNDIITFCRLEKEKNISLLIDAFSMLEKEFPDFKLRIFGTGSQEKELLKKISMLNLRGKIVLEGYSKNIHDQIKKSFMYVNSSNHEGLSNAMLETMAMGFPVVCTDCPCGGARMIIENRVNGLLIPVNEKFALYSAMKEVITDHELRLRISNNAKLIRNILLPDLIYKEWFQLILDNTNEKIAKKECNNGTL